MQHAATALLVALLPLVVAAQKPRKKAEPAVSYPSWSTHSSDAAPAPREGVSLATLRKFPEKFSGRYRVEGRLSFLDRAGETFHFHIENESGSLGSRDGGQFVLVSTREALATALTDRLHSDTTQIVTFDLREAASTDKRYTTFYRLEIVRVEFVDVDGATVAAID
jgi:hypothetical protein